MSTIIDFHTHIFPNSLETYAEKYLPSAGIDAVERMRRHARAWMRPFTNSVHKTQPLLRFLPGGARNGFDFLSGVASLPSLFVESTAKDLLQAMDLADVDASVVIAHPPYISNELVLKTANAEGPSSSRFIAAVNIPRSAERPAALLKSYAKNGAKLLKIHPAADGEGPKSSRYKSLLKAAAELKLPVIIHTGCSHSPLMFKEPELGRAELYAPWFKAHPELKFILAHMNYHEPQLALDLAVQYPNLHVDTSSQPPEAIGEAVRRIGAERVLFASDWPMFGNNFSIGRKRVRECVEIGLINLEQEKLILGENAVKLLGLQKVQEEKQVEDNERDRTKSRGETPAELADLAAEAPLTTHAD